MKDNEIELDKSVQENMVDAVISAVKTEEKESKKELTNAVIIDGFKAVITILLLGGILAAGIAVIVKMVFFIIGM